MPSIKNWSPKTVGIVAAIVTIVVWTSFIVIARAMALRSLLPLDIVFCRIVGCSLVLLPWGWWLLRRQRQRGETGPSWLGLAPLDARRAIVLGLFGGVGYGVLAYSGFIYAPAAHASVLMPGMLPLSTALLSVLLLGERLAPARWLGLGAILCGALLVGGGSLLHALDGGTVWRGDLLFVCASSCWAMYTVLCRKHRLAAVQATIAVAVFCAVSYLPAYPIAVAAGVLPSHLAQAPWGEILFQTFWQGGMSVVVSGISFTKMIEYFGPVRSTMLTAVVPGLSALGAVIFLNEPLAWNLLAGLALATLGIVLGVRANTAPALPAAVVTTAAPSGVAK